MAPAPPRVALFVTCLVDLMRPSVGFAALRLLREAGCRVEVPPAITCCGQPAFNAGDRTNAKAIAAQVIRQLAGFDYVVAPSGSCAGMIRVHYPSLFVDDPAMEREARAVAGRTHELVSFLVDVMGVRSLAARHPGVATYHDSGSGLRELGVKAQPRMLLASVEGLTLREHAEAETCCGFGGTFCVKYPEVAERLADDKLKSAADTGAHTLVAGDLGCLLHLAGRCRRRGLDLRLLHVAEVLTGDGDARAIAEPAE
jgi:L-lactate dehydrogenase complex protein LldE